MSGSRVSCNSSIHDNSPGHFQSCTRESAFGRKWPFQISKSNEMEYDLGILVRGDRVQQLPLVTRQIIIDFPSVKTALTRKNFRDMKVDLLATYPSTSYTDSETKS